MVCTNGNLEFSYPTSRKDYIVRNNFMDSLRDIYLKLTKEKK